MPSSPITLTYTWTDQTCLPTTRLVMEVRQTLGFPILWINGQPRTQNTAGGNRRETTRYSTVCGCYPDAPREVVVLTIFHGRGRTGQWLNRCAWSLHKRLLSRHLSLRLETLFWTNPAYDLHLYLEYKYHKIASVFVVPIINQCISGILF